MDAVIRDGKDEDLAFVRRAWVESHHRSDEARYLGPRYYATLKARVRRILASPSTTVRVAHVPGNEDAILGWSVSRGPLLHYVYVRGDSRGTGIAKALVLPLGITSYDHKPARGASRVPKEWAYLPEVPNHAAA